MQYIKTKKLAIVLFATLVILSLGNSALARQATPDIDQPLLLEGSGEDEISRQLGATATEGFFYASERTNIYTSLALLIRYLISFVGLIFVVVILYAGFQWMTASGNEEQVGKAKKLLLNGVIGVVVVIVSVSIWAFVVENLIENIAVDDRSTRDIEVWETECNPLDSDYWNCRCQNGDQSACQ